MGEEFAVRIFFSASDRHFVPPFRPVVGHCFFCLKKKNTSGALMGDTKNHPKIPFCLDCSVLKGKKSRTRGGSPVLLLPVSRVR